MNELQLQHEYVYACMQFNEHACIAKFQNLACIANLACMDMGDAGHGAAVDVTGRSMT